MGFIAKAVKGVVKAVVGVASKIIGTVLGPIVGAFGPKKAKSSNNLRLNKRLEPEDNRKIVFGKTASALDLRYWEVWGSSGKKYDEVIALATHRINSVKEFYAEDELAINSAGTVQTNFSGVLTRTYNLGTVGQTALSVGGGTQWNSSSKFDGVAHMKLAWVPNDKKLPNGVPSRYTQVIEGAYVYDPRRDSTVPGGSGSHRINDQSTWSYSTLDGNGVPIGRNNALQVLWYLLGWYIPNPDTSELVLVAGRGVDPNDINLATFITAANACEAAGYYTDMALSTGDSHTSNEEKITGSGLIGQLIDPGGLWSYYANVDDTANIAVVLTDDDLAPGAIQWNEYKPLSEQYTQVSGKFVDPAVNALYQLNGYPVVRDATYESNLGIKRRRTQDFDQVQDVAFAQLLARILLNTGQYQGEFSASWKYRAMKAQAYSVVQYTSERFGWTKLFRVMRHDIDVMRGVQMTLREIHPSIWTAGSVVSPAAPSAGLKFDPRTLIDPTSVAAAAYTGTGADGTIQDGMTVSWATPPNTVRRTEVRYKLTAATSWETAGPFASDITSVQVFPLLSGSTYNVEVRHISIFEVPGNWVATATNFTVGTNSNVGFGTLNGKTDTYYQASPPTGTQGDIWVDIDDSFKTYVHAGFGLYINGVVLTINGNAMDIPWCPAIDTRIASTIIAAAGAQATADGKVTTFVSETTPTAITAFGDLWYQPSTNLLKRWDSVSWNQVSSLGAPSGTLVGGVDAATIVSSLSNIASDNVLSAGEKSDIILYYNTITGEQAGLDAQATALGVTTQKTTYDTAVSDLTAYLGTLTTPVAWNNTSDNTDIVGTTFRGKFTDVYTARQALINAISAAAATLATWSGVSGSGKPADNATRNVVTYSSSAPSSPIDGDLWVDTSGTYAIFKLRSGGAWVTGANALAAYSSLTGKPTALADINSTESAALLAGLNNDGTVKTDRVQTSSIVANGVNRIVAVQNSTSSGPLITANASADICSISFTDIVSTAFILLGSAIFNKGGTGFTNHRRANLAIHHRINGGSWSALSVMAPTLRFVDIGNTVRLADDIPIMVGVNVNVGSIGDDVDFKIVGLCSDDTSGNQWSHVSGNLYGIEVRR